MTFRRALRGAATSALAVLALGGCGGEEVVEQAPVVRPVKIQTIGGATQGGTLEFPGTIGAAQEAEMAFEVGGKIEEFPVVEGDDVERGQILSRLDPRDYEAAREADAANAKAAKLLSADGIAALAEIHQGLVPLGSWTADSIEALLRQMAEESGRGLGKLAQPLRAALTGSNASPSLFEVMEVLGQDETLARIAAAPENAS